MNIYSFGDKLSESLKHQEIDKAILRRFFLSCARVDKTDIKDDIKGIDYVVRLKNGREIAVDVKRRGTGCSKFWKNGMPELALEIYSDLETEKPGWLFDGQKQTDIVSFVFDPSDYVGSFAFSTALLQNAVRRHYSSWVARYVPKIQRSHRNGQTWTSSCLIVPADVVVAGYNLEMCSGFISPEFAEAVSHRLRDMAANDNEPKGEAG